MQGINSFFFAGLRVRIHFIRIRVQNPDPDPLIESGSGYGSLSATLPFCLDSRCLRILQDHKLNMVLDLQSLLGLHVLSCTHWLRPHNYPPLGSYTRALLVSQD